MTIKEGIKRILLWLKKISDKIDGSGSSSGSGRYFPITNPLLHTELILDREIPGTGSVYIIDSIDSVDKNNLFLAKDKYERRFYFTNFYYNSINDVIEDVDAMNDIIIIMPGNDVTFSGGLFIDEDNKLKVFIGTTDIAEIIEIQYTPKLYIKN